MCVCLGVGCWGVGVVRVVDDGVEGIRELILVFLGDLVLILEFFFFVDIEGL